MRADLDRFRAIFFTECEEHVAEIERLLSQQAMSADDANALFRAVHSIKGGAGAFSLVTLVDFAHVFETALEDVRTGKVTWSDPAREICLRAADILAALIDDAEKNIVRDLSKPAADVKAQLEKGLLHARDPEKPGLALEIRPRADCLQIGLDPIHMVHALTDAELTSLSAQFAWPGLQEFDPTTLYLSWRGNLPSDADVALLRDLLSFLEEGDEYEILRQEGGQPDFLDILNSLDDAPDPSSQPQPGPQPKQANPTIRVDLERVDRVTDMASELTITQAALLQHVDVEMRQKNPEFARVVDLLAQQTRLMQDAIMAIRAQPMSTVFDRMPRLVRTLMDELGKPARVEIVGGAVEADRTVIERLVDPLTHLIRNAMDHGLESRARRAELGKPVEGLIRLEARQKAGRIIVSVSDDGGGIRRDKVLAIAKSRGIIPQDAELSPAEIDELIFAPGFSTSAQASSVSGRGVGTDVVRAAITAMGGQIHVHSEADRGAAFTLSLPLTLAVLDVMLVEAAGEPLVLPLANVIESVTQKNVVTTRLPNGEHVVMFRGKPAPIVDLRALVQGERPHPDATYLVFCESEEGDVAALQVDQVLAQQQVVIKNLETHFRRVEGYAGATILGDGRVALIIDMATLHALRKQSTKREAA